MAEFVATDERIARAVRAELDRSPQIDADRIAVDVLGTVVTLTGGVRDRAERSAAVRAALRVNGVRRVADRMHITARELSAIDNELNENVQKVIRAELGERTKVTARVHDRNVTLAGTVRSHAERTRVVKAISELPRARTIIDNLEIAHVSAPTSDHALQRAIVNQLEECQDVNSAEIGVAVHFGTAQLSGTVRSEREHDLAIECAFRVPGVQSIADDVRPEGPTYPSSDLALAAEVAAVLLGDVTLRNLPITCAVTDGVAVLRGAVSNPDQHRTVLSVISHLSGIVRVDDRLGEPGSALT